MITKILPHLTDGALILTANKRLARHLRLSYRGDQPTFLSLDALPLPSWLIRCYETLEAQGESIPLLLNDHQARQLWHSIISKSNHGLLQIQPTVQLAMQAWELLKHWDVNRNELNAFATQDSQLFSEWADQFEKVCKKNHWIDMASMPELLAKQIAEKKLKLPEKIICAGFIELPPAICSLLKNSSVIQIEPENKKASPQIIACQNVQHEIETMAAWANQVSKENPVATIGCIVPNLNRLRQTIDRLFHETGTTYNLSTGWPLSQEPVIAALFELLRFSHQAISFQNLSFLLRSPYVKGYEIERDARAFFEVECRKKNYAAWQKNNVISLPLFHGAINTVMAPQNQSPDRWAIDFKKIFQAISFYNQKEKQALERFEELLGEFETLDIINKTMSFNTALNALNQMASKTIFQPKVSVVDAPIQILGALEAVDIPFSHVWLMNMDDKTWPATPKPNPFIPVALQRQLNMPHCSAKRELDFAEQLSKRLTHQANNIVISYAQFESDQKNRLSPVFKGHHQITAPERKTTIEFSAPFEQIEDNIAPKIQTDKPVHGGATILKAQAECPFKAFATFRLNAECLESPHNGIDAKEKGNLLHHALEKIWRRIKTHEILCLLADEELKNIITESLTSYQNAFYQLENERLEPLLYDWLQYEKTRTPFEVIATEKKQAAQIGDLHLNLRIDRIDKTIHNDYVLIDYKTSKTDIKHWFEERISEPQLPLYAITQPEVSAIAFAQIRADEQTFNSVSQRSDILPNDKTIENLKYEHSAAHWQAQLTQWKNQCEQIAEEFCSGVASVTPKNETACAHCQLHSLCRHVS